MIRPLSDWNKTSPLVWFEEEVLKLIASEPNCGISLHGIYNSTCHCKRDMQDVADAVKMLIFRDLVHFRYSEQQQTDMYMPGRRPEDQPDADTTAEVRLLAQQVAYARFMRHELTATKLQEELRILKRSLNNRNAAEMLHNMYCDEYRRQYATYVTKLPEKPPNGYTQSPQ